MKGRACQLINGVMAGRYFRVVVLSSVLSTVWPRFAPAHLPYRVREGVRHQAGAGARAGGSAAYSGTTAVHDSSDAAAAAAAAVGVATAAGSVTATEVGIVLAVCAECEAVDTGAVAAEAPDVAVAAL